MSAEANIKLAYKKVGAKVVSIKRQMGNSYSVELEVNGRKMKQVAKDPDKDNWISRKLFEKSLRELRRLIAASRPPVTARERRASEKSKRFSALQLTHGQSRPNGQFEQIPY